MKIAVSGSAGIGKTSLIKYISPTLGYPIIDDFVDSELKKRGLNSPKELTDELARLVRFSALESKMNAEKSHESFLSDKSVVDYLAYWMTCTMQGAPKSETEEFFERAIKHSSIYDLIIIPPFGRFRISDNNKRSTNWHHQYRVHTQIKGLYLELGIPFQEYALNFDTSPIQVIKDLGL